MTDEMFEMMFELEDIIDIEENGYSNVYDITVSGNHTFILGNGIVTHNSAVGGIAPVLGRADCGFYALKGKPLNSVTAASSKFTSNKELSELFKIIKNEGYEKIIFATDADLDGCLTGDTLIPLVNGENVPIKDLVNRESFDVYSYTDNGQVRVGKGHSARITKVVNKLWNITLSNGETIQATDNHPFMLRNGVFVRADELKIGESLMPFKSKINDAHFESGKGFKAGYSEIFIPKENTWKFTHEHFSEVENGNSPERGFNIHHDDHNRLNNSPSNLIKMDSSEHKSLHAKDSYLVKTWNGSKEQEEFFQQEHVQQQYQEIGRNSALVNKYNGSSKNSEVTSSRNRDMWKSNDIYRDGKTYLEYMTDILRDRDYSSLSDNAKKQWSNEETSFKMQFSRVCSVILKCLENYGIVNEEFYNDLKPKTGVPKFQTLFDKFEIGTVDDLLMMTKLFINNNPQKLDLYPNAKQFMNEYNHTITNIEIVEVHDTEVYDITVDEYHNFATCSGAVVHNCHIRGLLLGFILKYLPEMKDSIGIFETPVKVIKKGKTPVRWTYDLNEELTAKSGETFKYVKGLGTWNIEDLKHIIKKDGLDKMMNMLEFDDDETILGWLGNNSEYRKEFILLNDFNIAKL